jgi:hypothetical protein
MERHLKRFMPESAGPYEVLIEDEGIDDVDRFALLYRLPNGKTVLDQFLASWPDLSAADREMLRGGGDPVDGIFEIRGKDGDSLILMNLVDDMEYRAHSNMGAAAFRPLAEARIRVRPPGSHRLGLRRMARLGRCGPTASPTPRRSRRPLSNCDQTARTGLPQHRPAPSVMNAYLLQHRQEAALAARPVRRRPSGIPGVDLSIHVPPVG